MAIIGDCNQSIKFPWTPGDNAICFGDLVKIVISEVFFLNLDSYGNIILSNICKWKKKLKLTRNNYQTITTDIFPQDLLLNKQRSDVGSCENYSITFLSVKSIFQHKTDN